MLLIGIVKQPAAVVVYYEPQQGDDVGFAKLLVFNPGEKKVYRWVIGIDELDSCLDVVRLILRTAEVLAMVGFSLEETWRIIEDWLRVFPTHLADAFIDIAKRAIIEGWWL